MLAKPAKILRNAIAFLTTNRGGVMKGDRSFCRKGDRTFFEPQMNGDGLRAIALFSNRRLTRMDADELRAIVLFLNRR
ncbi:MAG: hypothetical protein ACM65M_03600 [Microcoleus sp.]